MGGFFHDRSGGTSAVQRTHVVVDATVGGVGSMSETPLQFRHHGLVAGLRQVEGPMARTGSVAPRRRGTPLGWVGVPFMSAAAAALWWVGQQLPISEASFSAEISPVVEVVPEPANVPEVDAPPVAQSPPVPTPPVEVRLPPLTPKARPHASRTSAPPPRLVAELSLVRVGGVNQSQVPRVRQQIGRHLEGLRACSEGVMQRSPVKGAIDVRITVRDGRISAVVVDSDIHDTALRWCFRERLMGLPIAQDPPAVAFEARLEFFLLSRSRHRTVTRTSRSRG